MANIKLTVDMSFDPGIASTTGTKLVYYEVLRPARVPADALWWEEGECWVWFEDGARFTMGPLVATRSVE